MWTDNNIIVCFRCCSKRVIIAYNNYGDISKNTPHTSINTTIISVDFAHKYIDISKNTPHTSIYTTLSVYFAHPKPGKLFPYGDISKNTPHTSINITIISVYFAHKYIDISKNTPHTTVNTTISVYFAHSKPGKFFPNAKNYSLTHQHNHYVDISGLEWAKLFPNAKEGKGEYVP